MASFSRKTRIVGALVIAGVLVVGSIVISGSGLSFLNPLTVNAASTQELLQSFATRDSDNDGLPDWEEQLYGLDPNNAHSFSSTMTDGEAVTKGLVKAKFMTQELASSTDATTTDPYPDAPTAAPGSLTEQFSQALLTQYLSQNPDGSAPSEADITSLAEQTMQTLAQNNEHQDPYSLAQIQGTGTGPLALETYAVNIEEVFGKHNSHAPEGELAYFSDAVNLHDKAALSKVAQIAGDYTNIAPALIQLKVPVEAENAHLEIANATSRLGADITDLSMMDSDPLRAYLGLAQYKIDTASLSKGIADLGSVFLAEKVSIQSGDPGYSIYTFATTLAQTPATPASTQN